MEVISSDVWIGGEDVDFFSLVGLLHRTLGFLHKRNTADQNVANQR